MYTIKKLYSPSFKFVLMPGMILTLVVVLALLVFEAYVLILNHFDGKLPLPLNFGNHPHVIKMLTDQREQDAFRFAVIGDPKSVGTFERIAEQSPREALDFAVLLGDVSFMGKESYHRLLRAQIDEAAFGVPTFYVVGNHTLEYETFPKGEPFCNKLELN